MSRDTVVSADGGLRGLMGASVLVSAYIHAELYFEGMAQTPVIGPLFLLNAVGGLVIGLAVLFWRHWLPVLGALGFGALTLGAFWLSVTVGLFGFQEQASGIPQVAAEVAEIVAIATAGVWLIGAVRGRARATGGPRRSARRASA